MSLNVLVADDDLTVRETLQLVFHLEDFSTRFAIDGARCLAMAREQRPDVIVLDIMMPELDGHAVARQLRADPELEDVPIVFCSALAGDADIWTGWRLGADSYIPKPFDPDRLVAELRRVVSASVSSGAEGQDQRTVIP